MKSWINRIVDFLAPLGLVVVVGALAWARSGRTLPGKLSFYVLAGCALALVHLLLRWERVMAVVGRRQLKYGANTFVVVVVVVGILGVANWLVYRNTRRLDLTKGQRYSLSDQTQKVLKGLKDDVKITYFQRKADMAAGADRMKDFQAASPRLKMEFVDPLANPARAQAADARGPWPVLIVERKDRRERVSSDSEQEITNAILKVTREGKKTVCFATGEGERDSEDSGERGLSGAKSALTKSQYETQNVVLMREGKVPEACTVLLLAGPEKDLLPPVVDAIRAFVKGGGKAFVMIEPELKESYPALAALLKEWNVETAKDVVVDVSPMGQFFGTGPLTPLVAQYPYHEITRDFRLATAFHTARSIKPGSGTVEGVYATKLVETSRESWAETDLSLKGEMALDEGKDTQGPISIAVAATIRPKAPAASPSPSPSPSPAEQGEEKADDKKEGRLVVIGDADFATNQLLRFQGNQDFFLNNVAWLAQDVDLISIRPKEPEDQRLFLSRLQQQNVALLSLAVIPGLFLVFGIVVWWRRR